jgi:hypothetical protein
VAKVELKVAGEGFNKKIFLFFGCIEFYLNNQN